MVVKSSGDENGMSMDSMNAKENLFWGLVVKPDKLYMQEAPESFHVSMACVEPQSASGGATSIYLIRDGEDADPEEREVLICTLRSVIIKCKIDLWALR